VAHRLRQLPQAVATVLCKSIREWTRLSRACMSEVPVMRVSTPFETTTTTQGESKHPKCFVQPTPIQRRNPEPKGFWQWINETCSTREDKRPKLAHEAHESHFLRLTFSQPKGVLLAFRDTRKALAFYMGEHIHNGTRTERLPMVGGVMVWVHT
jgi:hypothetical protein